MISLNKILLVNRKPNDNLNGFDITTWVDFKNSDGESISPYEYTKQLNAVEIDISLIKGKKLHLTKSCTIPQFKREKFQEQHNVTFVRDITKGDYCVVGNKFLNKEVDFVGNSWMYKSSDIIAILNEIAKTKPLHAFHEKMIKLFNDEKIEYVAFYRWNQCDIEEAMYIAYNINLTQTPRRITSYFHVTSNPTVISSLDSLFNNNTIISQSVILKNLNSVVINNEQYEMLADLFNSRDEANVTLAIETIANSDYEKSAGYIMKLLFHYSTRIYSSRSRTHVNFKSMMNFFGLSSSWSIQDLLEALENKNLLSHRNLQILEGPINANTYLRNKYRDYDNYEYKEIVNEKFSTNEYVDDTDSYVMDYSNVELLKLDDDDQHEEYQHSKREDGEFLF